MPLPVALRAGRSIWGTHGALSRHSAPLNPSPAAGCPPSWGPGAPTDKSAWRRGRAGAFWPAGRRWAWACPGWRPRRTRARPPRARPGREGGRGRLRRRHLPPTRRCTPPPSPQRPRSTCEPLSSGYSQGSWPWQRLILFGRETSCGFCCTASMEFATREGTSASAPHRVQPVTALQPPSKSHTHAGMRGRGNPSPSAALSLGRPMRRALPACTAGPRQEPRRQRPRPAWKARSSVPCHAGSGPGSMHLGSPPKESHPDRSGVRVLQNLNRCAGWLAAWCQLSGPY